MFPAALRPNAIDWTPLKALPCSATWFSVVLTNSSKALSAIFPNPGIAPNNCKKLVAGSILCSVAFLNWLEVLICSFW